MKLGSQLSLIVASGISLGFAVLLGGCAPTEKTTALYPAEKYQFKPITLSIPSTVDDIAPIEPDGVRRLIYKIPLLNRLLAIPLDLTQAILPPLPFNQYLQLTEDEMSVWGDKGFLDLVKSLKLKQGWLREKTDAELIAKGQKPGKTSFLCKNKGIQFIHQLKLILEYTDPRYKNGPVYQVPLAYTDDSKQFFDKKNRKMTFKVDDVDLRPYIEDVRAFRLKLEAKGGFPCNRTYLQAGFEVDVKIEVKTLPSGETPLWED